MPKKTNLSKIRHAGPVFFGTLFYQWNDSVFTVLQCSGLEVATGDDGRSVLLMMKADEPLGRAEREAGLPIRNKFSNGMSTPQKADFPEPGLQEREAWEMERKTALAQIQNALKFCVLG
jgi:hypothetical protein